MQETTGQFFLMPVVMGPHGFQENGATLALLYPQAVATKPHLSCRALRCRPAYPLAVMQNGHHGADLAKAPGRPPAGETRVPCGSLCGGDNSLIETLATADRAAYDATLVQRHANPGYGSRHQRGGKGSRWRRSALGRGQGDLVRTVGEGAPDGLVARPGVLRTVGCSVGQPALPGFDALGDGVAVELVRLKGSQPGVAKRQVQLFALAREDLCVR